MPAQLCFAPSGALCRAVTFLVLYTLCTRVNACWCENQWEPSQSRDGGAAGNTKPFLEQDHMPAGWLFGSKLHNGLPGVQISITQFMQH